MFSSLSTFHHSLDTDSFYFTDPSVELFPSSNEDNSNDLNTPLPSPAPNELVPDVELNTRLPSPAPTEPVPDVDIVPASRHSTRVSNPPTRLNDYYCYSAIKTLHEPSSYREANTNPIWQQAVAEEIQALEKTNTWELVDLPADKIPIGCKWIYKIKTRFDGTVERYKARLVAKGYTQEYGIDYEETFAPVARITSVRSLLAIAAVRKWKLFQMDVKNAFLHGDSGIVILLLYVDDMIITGDDKTGISALQQYLSQHFKMKDLGSLSYFLGLEVSQDSEGYYLSQAKYASDLLSRAGITDCKTELTPLEVNSKLTPLDDTPLEDATLYRQLVGSLVYLTVTRPDIAYAVHKVSQFMAAPRSSHFSAVLRIIRYVKGTIFHGLRFSANSSLVLSGYSDADWAGDPTDRRSTTGYYFFLGNSLLSWRSKKQTVVARSST